MGSWRGWAAALAIAVVLVQACAKGEVIIGDEVDETTTAGGGGGTVTASGGGGGDVGGATTSTSTTSYPCGIDCGTIQTDDCHVAVCNEDTKQCEVKNADDATPCEDGQFCTVDDACVDGTCIGGPQNDCGQTPGECDAIVCNESSKSCSKTPQTNGNPCTSSDKCQVSSTCQNGLCIGTPKDCFFAPVPDDCHVAQCNPMNGNCEPVPGNEGQACVDSKDLCTVTKTCAAGVCQGGKPKDCSALTQGCNTGVCDTMTGQCTTKAVMQGQQCDDLDACTTGETCNNGTCAGGTPVTQCVNNDQCCPNGCTENNDTDCAKPFAQPSYNATMVFLEASQLQQTRMSMAWDGTSFWASSGGSSNGNRVAKHDAAGNVLAYYQPGIDMRALFTKPDGSAPVYARGYGSMTIRVQQQPGVFANDVTLQGSLDGQAAVVWDGKNGELIAMEGGKLYRWNAVGTSLGTVTLQGFGTMNNENTYPQNRGVCVSKGWYMTYANGVLSAWDQNGTRIDTTTLNGAGKSFDSHFSLSYAQGKVFIVDGAGGSWRGYNVGI